MIIRSKATPTCRMRDESGDKVGKLAREGGKTSVRARDIKWSKELVLSKGLAV